MDLELTDYVQSFQVFILKTVVISLRPQLQQKTLTLLVSLERMTPFQARENQRLPISHHWIAQLPRLQSPLSHSLQLKLFILKDCPLGSRIERVLMKRKLCVYIPRSAILSKSTL